MAADAMLSFEASAKLRANPLSLWPLQPIVTCVVSYGSKRKHNKDKQADMPEQCACFGLSKFTLILRSTFELS